ncbi:hypothetical protein P4O66_010341, partial [Electrophorus voltai]
MPFLLPFTLPSATWTIGTPTWHNCGHISNDDETAYREEIQHVATWRSTDNLYLVTKQAKELIMDYRKTKGCTHSPVHINGTEVENVSSFKFLGVHISEDLSWTLNTSYLFK